ncbi:hypothetical protein KVR01_003665 [Diaporthe batatas]|uniref:uncharacterized protein n=1 Tax=Diaporthe batatas TaxID=748121 RepID=UPI001D0562AF|nr:uncharacterized protein KVR01_003665 [Diaporthe batatas]KAG8167976.1 hypothetical protein KVR01_003665 [Diaporthe batatas]
MPDQPPTTQGQQLLRWDPINDDVLEEIYKADQAIYPAPLLTYERMRSWATSCPDLSICLRRHDPGHEPAAEGLVIVLPVVEEYWGRLVAGELREHDVDPDRMFPPAGAAAAVADGPLETVQVGLHVFHIERDPSGGRTPGFTPKALDEIRSRVGERFPSWRITGYSALTATPQGNRAFKRLGFTSRYVETKDDGDEAEMLVREGNGAFSSP